MIIVERIKQEIKIGRILCPKRKKCLKEREKKIDHIKDGYINLTSKTTIPFYPKLSTSTSTPHSLLKTLSPITTKQKNKLNSS